MARYETLRFTKERPGAGRLASRFEKQQNQSF